MIVLASKSPRRQELLKLLNIPFEIRTKEVEEIYPNYLKGKEVAEYLANLKAIAFEKELQKDELIITSDTIVCVDDIVLGKPKNKFQAKDMLQLLSDREHQVITGVCLKMIQKTVVFHNVTNIHFKKLSTEEIDFYIHNYKPFDKAGSYGIQEWIGAIGVTKIEGCYFNVVGLPLRILNEKLNTEFKIL